MKKVLIMVTMFLLVISTMEAKKFDFGFLKGIKFGMAKAQLEKLLKEEKIKYEIKNNGNAGKFWIVEIDTTFQNSKISELRIGLKNSKINVIGIYFDSSNIGFDNYLDKICNCTFYYEEGDVTNYYFDNCTIGLYTTENNLFIFPTITKCDD